MTHTAGRSARFGPPGMAHFDVYSHGDPDPPETASDALSQAERIEVLIARHEASTGLWHRGDLVHALTDSPLHSDHAVREIHRGRNGTAIPWVTARKEVVDEGEAETFADEFQADRAARFRSFQRR